MIHQTKIAATAAYFWFLVLALGFVLMRIVGPAIEVKIIPPVTSLSFSDFECVGGDMIITGVLNKTTYPLGLSATLLANVDADKARGDDQIVNADIESNGLNIYTVDYPAVRIPWHRTTDDDRSPNSRPPGSQEISLYLIDGCNKQFRAYTRHQSPITGNIIEMTWGPFGPGG